MSHMLQPSIILLKEGTDTSQGKNHLLANISACMTVVDQISSALGPRGRDKLIVDSKGVTTISNDGATIMNLLDVVHPAARTLVDIAHSQDSESGDGTTSVVLLAGEFLKMVRDFIEEGIHPRVIMKGFGVASDLCVKRIEEVKLSVDQASKNSTVSSKRDMLEKCAETALNSKLISAQKEFFGKMAVDSVCLLDEHLLDLSLIGIKKVQGGALEESILVPGVAFKKTFSYAGFEQQPKKIADCKIALLNMELELKSEKDQAEVRVDNVDEYQAMIDAEWKIIYGKLEKIVDSGANIVFSRVAIGDLATQYFADRHIFCAGRVDDDDMKRISQATGAKIQTTVSHLTSDVLGRADLLEEKQLGAERYNFLTGCPATKTATIVLRGGADQFMDEAARSLHDSIMVVRRAIKNMFVVAGGGAIEMELSRYLLEQSKKIPGKQQLVVRAVARGLEVIPRLVAENGGFDSIDILNRLRSRHTKPDGIWYGVDIINEGICDTMASFVWEPASMKTNAIKAALEASILILSIDETVKNPSQDDMQRGTEFEEKVRQVQGGQMPGGGMMPPGMGR